MDLLWKSIGKLKYKNHVDFKSCKKEELGIDWIK